MARLSKDLVTIRRGSSVTLDLDAMRVREPDYGSPAARCSSSSSSTRSRRALGDAAAEQGSQTPATAAAPSAMPEPRARNALHDRRTRSRRSSAGRRARATCTVHRDRYRNGESIRQLRSDVDPLRSPLVGLTIAVGTGRGVLLSARASRTRRRRRAISTLGSPNVAPARATSPRKRSREKSERADEHRGARARARASSRSRTCRRSTSPQWRRSARCSKIRPSRRRRRTRSTRRSCCGVAGVTLQGLEFDTMVASYVLDPGRRSHGLDLLALGVPRPQDDDVRGALREGKDVHSVRPGPDRVRRVTTRAKTPT